jgi:DNA-binding NtrC family response regulator
LNTRSKLLIVDDELSVRDSLGKWFHEEGYDVSTAENARDALTRLAENRWDVALVDIKMQGTKPSLPSHPTQFEPLSACYACHA